MAALKQWMGRVGRPAGPLFRRVRGAVIEHQRTISRIVEQTAKRAGVVGDFSAHSLRAGYATSAKEAGVAELDIQAHGRWAHRVSLARYIDTRRTPTGRDTAAGLL